MAMLRFLSMLLLSVFIWLLVSQYLFCPQYIFKRSHPFTGQQFYNPYQEIKNDTHWIKSNLHTHTKSWGGITNGSGTPEEFRRVYDSLNYGVLGFSNYHAINNTHSSVPVYEHGYNMQKVHQLVVADNKITWKDYIFPQTRSNKQQLLTQLGNADNVIILAHPALRNAYTKEDLKVLSGYQCMEVISPAKESLPQWDAALSAGKVVYAVGNDDIHNIYNPARLAKYCTWLHLPGEINAASIITALKEGKGYAMKIGAGIEKEEEEPKEKIKSKLPSLNYCVLQENSLQVKFSRPATQIQFSGDDGNILSLVKEQDSSTYKIKTGDSYVRVSAFFQDGTEIYLNPVFRTNAGVFTGFSNFSINTFKTNLFSFAGVILLTAWGFFLFKFLNVGVLKRLRMQIQSPRNIRIEPKESGRER